MFDAKVMQVIVTNLELRGNGEKGDPHRRITQYWTLDGQLLAEVDPYKQKVDAFKPVQIGDAEGERNENSGFV